MRIVIVDDEPLGRLAIRQQLADLPDAEIVAECQNGTQAVEAVVQQAPDLMFLDVQMPGLSGFDVLEQVGADAVPAVVFVTAYDRYALKAFEAHALDYLLKPVDPARFREAYARAAREVERESHDQVVTRLARLLEARTEADSGQRPAPAERIVVKLDGRLHFLPTDTITWVEAAGNYVKLHTQDRVHLVRRTLGQMGMRLGTDRFVRIRRSVLVSVAAIQSLEPYGKGSYAIRLKDGTKLLSSRYAGPALRALLER
jgi:two-component system LytT family response regulator